MSTLPIFPYNEGDGLRVDTINQQLRNSANVQTQRGMFGGGVNAITDPLLHKQSMADSTEQFELHECVIIEPIRSPSFYDSTITPNPMAVTPDGLFLNVEIAPVANNVISFMSMGLIRIIGKTYLPLPATYVGNEEIPQNQAQKYQNEDIEYRRTGEQRKIWVNREDGAMSNIPPEIANIDDWDEKPLYLLQRELVMEDNRCTRRRGANTSYPFKWRYVKPVAPLYPPEAPEASRPPITPQTKNEPFSSGTNDFGNDRYVEFIYLNSRQNIGGTLNYGELTDDDMIEPSYNPGNTDKREDVEQRDYFEMKPYYGWSTVQIGERNVLEGSQETFIGISPQPWALTTNPDEAQMNYDFAWCPDLEFAEALVPGERMKCFERFTSFLVPKIDERGQPMYKYLLDSEGNVVLDNNGDPVYERDKNGNLIRDTQQRVFRYYEILPPDSYKTYIEGQPDVEMQIGLEERQFYAIDGDGFVDNIVDAEGVLGVIGMTTLQRARTYIQPEDIVTPEFEMVYVDLEKKSSAKIVNPLAVIQDIQTDRNGNLTKRLRAVWYKTDEESRKFPMLFEVDILSYGFCIEAGIVKQFVATGDDTCAPHQLREEYDVVRMERGRGRNGMTLQLATQKCFKHRLQIPTLVKK